MADHTADIIQSGDLSEIQRLHKDALVIDIHLHGKDFLPRWLRPPYHFVVRKTMPPFQSLSGLSEGGVDGAVVMAAGGRFYTRFFPFRGSVGAVMKQLGRMKRDLRRSNGFIAYSAEDIVEAKRKGTLSALLGVEGGDVIGESLEVVDELYHAGVRVIGLITYEDNAIGTVGASFSEIVGTGSAEISSKREGLTPFGERLVNRMNDIGMIIDCAHASYETTMDVTSLTKCPVISSHTGLKAVFDWARYISDDEVRAIARTGGVIGLWPMYMKRRGMATLDDFSRQVKHVLRLVGEDHLAVGTDLHGCPGFMEGYFGMSDAPIITRVLFNAGLNENQVRKVLGENFLRVLREVVGK